MTTIWRATVLVSLCLVTAACQTGHPRADESFAVPSAEEPAPWTELTLAAYADLPAQLPEGSTIEAIAQAPSGYVAVGGSLLSGDGIVLVSAEGINWSVVSDADLADVHLAEAAANGTQLVAVGTGSASGAAKGKILTTSDGVQWDLAFEAGDAAINSVAADPNGNFLAVATYENTWAVIFSNDGRTWDVRSPADLGLPDDSSVGDVGATSVGWMLVGSVGSSARAWSSADGETWADVPISGSDPVEGVASVEVSALIVSGHEAIATGIDHPPCDRLPDECPLYGAAWVLSDTGWNRLPADSAPSEFAGERVWSIRDGFVMSRQLEILASADGWSWTPVTIDEQITFLNAVLETRGEVLIAGDTPAEDGISQPWIAIARSDR